MNKDGFKISPDKDIKTTPVKNQDHTGTCWSFSTISFVETELLRMGKEPLHLSEMFVVRKNYPRKAERYIRLHGNMSFGASSLSGDVLYVIRKHGIVPESVYSGKPDGQSQYDNEEMDAVLKASLDAIIRKKMRKLSKAWPKAIDGILDAYLGEIPESFPFKGKSYTPKSFAGELGFNPDDYIELTSYRHHPFYTTFSLEVPDNWSLNKYLNVPLDEFMSVLDHALQNGYSLAWDGDISENSFSQKKGLAILPVKEWEDRTKEEQDKICEVPEPEKEVTQELRQESFDNFTSTDDHLMHITGTAYDQRGTKYYKAKNSWGQKDSKYEGFIYL
ncbi:aminopeptidase, partial [candidate division KSB1 bacterium]|nr:aminopeptidase [candidate division KSB1 bacterium]